MTLSGLHRRSARPPPPILPHPPRGPALREAPCSGAPGTCRATCCPRSAPTPSAGLPSPRPRLIHEPLLHPLSRQAVRPGLWTAPTPPPAPIRQLSLILEVGPRPPSPPRPPSTRASLPSSQSRGPHHSQGPLGPTKRGRTSSRLTVGRPRLPRLPHASLTKDGARPTLQPASGSHPRPRCSRLLLVPPLYP